LTEINLTTENAPAELLENELTKKALSIVERSAMSEAQLNTYEKYWMNLTDEEGIALARYNRGVKDGMAQGEQKKAMSVARNLKLMNLSVADIAKATGLTEEDIDKL
jgi:predicted transposase/invertase (TIGR01784 family)